MIKGPGFDTPEDAAEAYLTALRDQDIDAMISCFAVESYADHYDFEYMTERINAYYYSWDMPYPNTSEYNRMLNIEGRRGGIVKQIMIQYMYYNAPEALNNGAQVYYEDRGALSDFIDDFGDATQEYVFSDLNVIAALSSEGLSDDPKDALDALLEKLPEDVRDELTDEVPEDEIEYMLGLYLSEENQTNLARQVKAFGAKIDDVASVAIIFEGSGDTWLFCPQAIRYDGKWYLQLLQCNVANLAGMNNYTGGIAPID